jgi:nicotinate phosphoribosyltransferase
VGTVPHGLIAAFGGDTVAATEAFARQMPAHVKVISLVDFRNNCVREALAVARALGPRLHGVRLDTSGHMVDESVQPQMGEFDPRGVNPQLVRNVREALDAEGFDQVNITVSGGFDVEKIERFKRLGVPVDSYGVGSALIRGRYDFTADVVVCDGKDVAKAGRRFRPNDRLERVMP